MLHGKIGARRLHGPTLAQLAAAVEKVNYRQKDKIV
jgi:hypothetical protein